MHVRTYRMGYFVDGRSGNPGGGNEDGRGGKKVREYRPVATIVKGGCIERVPPRYEPCGEPVAPDSGAYCAAHKVEVRKNT